jgi:hypothetical protein
MLYPSIEIPATHPRHAHVTEDHIVALAGEQFEGFPTIPRAVYMMAV